MEEEGGRLVKDEGLRVEDKGGKKKYGIRKKNVECIIRK